VEHAAVAGYTGARYVMKADFGCGILLWTFCLMSSVTGRGRLL
jgi:hypothetical protein